MNTPSAEHKPNDPDLFNDLVANMTRLTITEGDPFFFLFATGDASTSMGMNAYPFEPEEMYGHGDDVMFAHELKQYKVHTDPHIVAEEVGRVLYGKSSQPDCNRSSIIWAFNESSQRRYGRVGEIALSRLYGTNDQEAEDADIYWVEGDRTVWFRDCMRPERPRHQLLDFDLEELCDIVHATRNE